MCSASVGRRTVVSGLPARPAGAGRLSAQAGSTPMSDAPFAVAFDPALRSDLRRRLADTRWSDAVAADWSDGTDKGFLQALTRRWRTAYDFDAAERRMNALPQYRASVDGFGIHYVRLQGVGPRPKPLLLMNGWPSSFVEYRRLAPMLADPAAFGGSADDAFEVVMPALPGFGYSDRPTRPAQVWAEDVFHRLMTGHLGHARYLASGTDIGAGVATRLALKHPEALQGIHISAVADPVLTPASPPPSPAELAFQARAARWEAEEGAYEHLHYTRPQTLAFALADSPVGLASWIVEKFHAWSDHGDNLLDVFPADMLLDTLMVYWASGTIGSSMRSYYEHSRFRPKLDPADRVSVPTALCLWPKDLAAPPREWAERLYDVRQYAVQAQGGHFPAWEAPDAYARDLRRFARSLDA